MDPIGILGLITVIKDLTEITNGTTKFVRKVAHARAELEAYCSEVKVLELIEDIPVEDPKVQVARLLVQRDIETLRSLTGKLKIRGVRSRFKYAFKDKHLDHLLNALGRTKNTLLLISQLTQANTTERRQRRIEAQLDALQSNYQDLVVTTNDVQATLQEVAHQPRLQSTLCAASAFKIQNLPPLPTYITTLHDENSYVVHTMLNGTRLEVIKLLTTGKAHPAHFVNGGRKVSNCE